MKKVKFNPSVYIDYNIPKNLTIGKVYDVHSYNFEFDEDQYNTLEILDDNNDISSFYILDVNGIKVFEDVTDLCRNEIINDILDCEKS